MEEMKVCSSSREMEALLAQENKGIFSQAEIRAQLLLHWHLREVWAKIFSGGKMIKYILIIKAKFLGMSPCRHLEVSAPELPVTSDSVDYYMVLKCVLLETWFCIY